MQKHIVNVGIFAHIDAGKTTLTEQLLVLGGMRRSIGSVDSGTASTDFLSVEKKRGISVRDADAIIESEKTVVHIIDTPGHADFIEEAELALTACDMAILVVSAVEGIQAQTEILLSAMLRRNLPLLFFINKCDRAGAKPQAVLAELATLCKKEILPLNSAADFAPLSEETYLENAVTALNDETLLEGYLSGEVQKSAVEKACLAAFSRAQAVPAVFGVARTGKGCDSVLSALQNLFVFPRDDSYPFSAFVYQVEHRKNLGKVAHVRLFGGTLAVRQEVTNLRTGSTQKIAQIKRIQGEKASDETLLACGDIGAVTGLADVRAGDVLGAKPPVEPLRLSDPYLRIRILPKKSEDLLRLKDALFTLCDESPSLATEWIPEKRELNVNTAGAVQVEILQELLEDRFSLATEVGTPSVIYRETPVRSGFGFEYYTMPKPCWAVVRFFIEPLPTGSGLVYESTVSEKKIAYRYQEHVATAVPRALQQGMHGWQVTDLKVTLVDGEDHPQHTHPLDFFTATPMGIMDGLRNTGTKLLEPVLSVRVTAPETAMGKIISEISPRRAKLDPPVVENGYFLLAAEVPASESFDLPERIASVSGGRAVYTATLSGYFPCPEGLGKDRERVGINPLDRSKWILHSRSAL